MNNDITYVQPIPLPSGPNPLEADIIIPPYAPTEVPYAPIQPQLIIHDGSIDESQTSQLVSQGYTHGMTQALSECIASFPLRIWVVDNSGSMANVDGSRLVLMQNKKDYKTVSCTRWKEIQETMDYHIQLTGLLKAPTSFRMLNNPGQRVGKQIFGVADKGEDLIPSDMEVARRTMMNTSPSGVTPLSEHIYEIREQVLRLAPQLSAQGCKVAIILATDGLPTDVSGRGGEQESHIFTEALRSLEGLPIWIVIRLCTDDDAVVEFYNNIDTQLEVSVEVLDNFTAEAAEIYQTNPWLNYTLPLHRMREMGFQNRLFDLLDERTLTIGELREFCILIFGVGKFDGVPEPEVDFKAFLKGINSMMITEETSWNPITKKQAPLLNVRQLELVYGGGEDGAGCNCTIA